MRVTRLAYLSRQLHQKQAQSQPQPQSQSPQNSTLPKPQITHPLHLPYPRTQQDFLAYRLSGISRDKLRQESSDPEHDLRRFVGNAAVNRASVNWVHRDLMRRVDEIEQKQKEVASEIEVLHLEVAGMSFYLLLFCEFGLGLC